MKLLYITNGINGPGGLERVLSVKASLLADNYGYEVSILVLNNGDKKPFYHFSPKIKFYSIEVKGNPYHYLLSYKNGIQKMVNTIKPNIVSVCDDGLKGFFVPKLLKSQTKIIYERHASIELGGKSIKNKILQRIMKSQVNRFDRFVVLTASNVKEWESSYNKNIISISNPLSFESTDENGLTNKKVIAVGTHTYNKGYDILLEIWRSVEDIYPDWHLEIYGKSDKDSINEKLAEKLALRNVTFFEPVNDIQSKYLDASIMVMTSRSEGFGMVLIEAMECGLPCIAFDCPSGPRDIINNEKNGFLIPQYDKASFASSLLRLISNYDLRTVYGRRAKENVKRFSPNRIVMLWDSLFKSISQ